MKKVIRFAGFKDVTNPEMDGKAMSFPFSVLDCSLIGSPEEESSASSHRLIVSISGTRLAVWGLTGDDLPKVLFEYGRRHIAGMVEKDTLPDNFTIRMPIITRDTHPGPCPLELSRLGMPDHTEVIVEVRRQIGFK